MKIAEKWTVSRIRDMKGRGRIACLTAYDFYTAQLLDEAGFPMILVGDSLGMTVLGYETTLPVTMEDMLRHTAAVVRGTRRALVVADMPFLSYQISVEEAIRHAGRLLKEAGADAVKIEGGLARAETIRRLIENGIPVLGHIGLLPQSVRAMGGYRTQGRTPEAAEQLRRDAQAVENAGCFAVVLECVTPTLAEEITRTVGIPTIGIGSGPRCDGQVLVVNDLLGLTSRPPGFARPYAQLRPIIADAFRRFRQDVETGAFPE